MVVGSNLWYLPIGRQTTSLCTSCKYFVSSSASGFSLKAAEKYTVTIWTTSGPHLNTIRRLHTGGRMPSQLGTVRFLKIIQGRQVPRCDGFGDIWKCTYQANRGPIKSVSRVVPTTCVKLIVCQVVVKSSRVYVSEARKKGLK